MLFRLESKRKWKNLKGSREKFKIGILCRWGGGAVRGTDVLFIKSLVGSPFYYCPLEVKYALHIDTQLHSSSIITSYIIPHYSATWFFNNIA